MKNVDFRNGRPLVMMVSQYDFGYNLQVALWSNGTPVTITAAEIVSENFTAACTFTGNVVTIPVTTSMTEQFGHFPAELRVTDSTGQVSSKNFDWFVERSPLAVKSTETYSGDIVEFTAKRVPLSSVVVTMEPIQDLNGYSSPWPAGGGKNLLDAALLKDQAGWNIIPLKVKPDTIYTMSTDKPNDDLYLYFKNTNIAGGGSSDVVYAGHPVTVTSTSDGYVYVPQRRASGTDSFQNYHYQIEEGSTETDYTPYSNICPITGRTGASVVVVGKNLFADKGQGYWRVSDGAFITSGTTAQTYRSCEKIPVIAGAQYTGFVISTYDQPTNVYVQWWKADGTGREVRITQWPIVAPDDAVLMSYAFRFASTTIASEAVNVIQVEQSGSATEYEENTTTTYPITFTSAGTVYAGTVDLVSGVLTVTHAGVSLDGSETYSRSGITPGNGIACATSQFEHAMASGSWLNDENALCSSLPKVATTGYFGIRFGANNANLYFYEMGQLGITTIEAFKSWVADNNIQITYPLATPLTYTLTPTQVMSLLGENVVWSPDGEVTVVVPEFY